MSTKPPGRNRPASSRISVDLGRVLEELFTALEFTPGPGSPTFGSPGEYTGTSRCPDTSFGFAVDYLAREIMSKFDDADKASEERKTSEALAKFREAEALCCETNTRFAKYFYGHRPDDPDVSRAIIRARDKIWRLLGTFDWDEVSRDFALTNGASAKLPKRYASGAHKFSSAIETTDEMEPAVSALLEWAPSWGRHVTNGPGRDVVPGNRLICVPKNYKVHRTIAAEPFAAMFLQKGLGAVLKKRLRSVGVDLSSQTQNQDWAMLGSKTGMVATVDMSMASDTVSDTVVEWFLPDDWYEALSVPRSRIGQFASGEKVLYRKFSSMGNAATFELETLIFWALACASCDVSGADSHFVGVYGDDVVVPTRSADLFLRVLKECGFKPNEKKTFVAGRFRESCGKHYLSGEDVTPFYIRKKIDKLPDLFLLANNLERWRRRACGLDGATDDSLSEVKKVIETLRSLAPSSWRKPRIPDGYGDGAFIGTFDECRPSRPRGKYLWFEGWQVEVLSEKRDIAIGVVYDTNGQPRPVFRSSKGKRVVGKEPNAALGAISLPGYLLSSLCKMEGKADAWNVEHSRYTVGPLLAERAKQIGETVNGGIVTDDSTRWETTTMVVAQF